MIQDERVPDILINDERVPYIYMSLSLSLGFLRDRLGSYDVAFYLAGIPPIIGGAVLCLIPWVEARRIRREQEAAKDVTQILEFKRNSGGQGDALAAKTADAKSVI